MKYQTRFSLILCAAALAVPANADHRFPGRDTNGDGRISRSEWRGNAQSFATHDHDRSGYIEEDETPGASRTGSRNRSAGVGRLDRNFSGAVEGFEWPYNSKVFHQLDTDANSVLTADELRNITSATMIQLDRNDNNRIEPREWPGGFAQFDDLDEDGDRQISATEYFNRGGEWQRRQRFDEWDKDRNGYISSTEWRSRPPLFHRLDTDRDSRLSWNEFMSNTDTYEQPFGWR